MPLEFPDIAFSGTNTSYGKMASHMQRAICGGVKKQNVWIEY